MTPIKFIESCPRGVNHLYATDYIVYGFTPEQAWIIDEALNLRWTYFIYAKQFYKHFDGWFWENAMIAQGEYLKRIEELRA